jgi:four helix bundle protein
MESPSISEVTRIEPAQSVRALKVWQRSMELARKVYELTQEFPREETYTLISSMRRSSIAIPSKIAEGQGRCNPREFAHFLESARGSLCELQTQLDLARSFHYGRPELIDASESLCQEIGKMLFALARRFKTTS